jgi:Hydroxyethylthiazole kinase family
MARTDILGNVVVVTGKDDVISDGARTIVVSNGHPMLSQITGVLSLSPFVKLVRMCTRVCDRSMRSSRAFEQVIGNHRRV